MSTVSRNEPGFISLVTMAETVWVLDRLYRLTAREISDAVEHMLQADTLMIQNEQEIFAAVIALRTGTGSFADALISELARGAGCDVTFTFDKKATKLKGFELI